MKNFEEFLQDKFMDLREIGGVPIMKDNYEDLFDGWLSNLDGQEYIDFADEFAAKLVLETKEKMLEGFEPTIALLANLKSAIEK